MTLRNARVLALGLAVASSARLDANRLAQKIAEHLRIRQPVRLVAWRATTQMQE
jgi:hypothetical protein